MTAKPIKLKETPHAAPVGAAMIDADYVVVGGSFLARMKRAAVRLAVAVTVAGIIGALIPPLLIAAEALKR